MRRSSGPRQARGGLIVAAGSKEDGIQPLRKQLAQLGLESSTCRSTTAWLSGSRVRRMRRSAIAKLSKSVQWVEEQFETIPGLFSHDRVDAGSELLASRLPTDFDGNAADLGAGWGYLSSSSPKPRHAPTVLISSRMTIAL